MEPKDQFAEVRGLKLHYLEWGSPEAPPMLLLHGSRGHAHLWDFFSEAMADRYHILALDQRGHGESEHSPDLAYRPEDYVQDLVEFAETVRLEPFVLIAHSMGALNAMIYAGTHPERVSRLVIVDIEASLSQEKKEFMKGASYRPPRVARDLEEATEKEARDAPKADPEVLRHFSRHLYKRSVSGIRFMTRTDRGTLAFFDEYDAMPYLPDIACPTLIVRGGESNVLSAEAAWEMSMIIPRCRVVEIEGATHQVMLDRPKEFLEAVWPFVEGAP